MLGISVILFLHNSFGLPGIPTIRVRDLRILTDSYPLNIPWWFNDNHPVDFRAYGDEDVVSFIARDAQRNFSDIVNPIVTLAVDCLTVNHNLYEFLSRDDPVVYFPWINIYEKGVALPQYVIVAQDYEDLCRGPFQKRPAPQFPEDVKQGKVPYEFLTSISSAENGRIEVYRKKS
jgi:hypothetical protein